MRPRGLRLASHWPPGTPGLGDPGRTEVDDWVPRCGQGGHLGSSSRNRTSSQDRAGAASCRGQGGAASPVSGEQGPAGAPPSPPQGRPHGAAGRESGHNVGRRGSAGLHKAATEATGPCVAQRTGSAGLAAHFPLPCLELEPGPFLVEGPGHALHRPQPGTGRSPGKRKARPQGKSLPDTSGPQERVPRIGLAVAG